MRLLLCIIFLCGLSAANAQLIFKNTNLEKAYISKFVVNQNQTQLFVRTNTKETLLASWNKIPSNTISREGQNQFQMTAVLQEKGVTITFEVQYSLYRKTNKHIGYIKTKFIYSDKRPIKITEDYFST